MLPLLVSCHSLIRVLLPTLESMKDKIYATYRSCSTKVYEQNPWSIQHLNYWERLPKFELYSLQRRRDRYIIICIWNITRHIVPNINVTMGHKIKSRNHPRHGTKCVIEYPTNKNTAQFLQENPVTVFVPRLYSLPKYLRNIESVKLKNSNLNSTNY